MSQALTGGSGLKITGSSNLTRLTEGHAQEFDGMFHIENTTSRSITVDKQLFFFAGPGGYAYQGPSFDIWWGTLWPNGGLIPAGPFGWGLSHPVSHLVVRVDGSSSSGSRHSTMTGIPVVAAGKSSPGSSPYNTTDVVLGVQAPLEAFTLTNGKRWLGITGTVTDTTRTSTTLPTVKIVARNSSASTVATLQTALTGPGQPPIHTFIAWTAIPSGSTVVDVRATGSQAIQGGTSSQTRTIPVVNLSPPVFDSPVSGTWTWGNGPGQTVWHAHTGGPEARYAYDLCIDKLVNGQWQVFQGDPKVNSNYFCWAKPIRTAGAGIVRFVQDQLPDNSGNVQDNNQGNNEVTIEHANGVFTNYAHLRQGSARVRVGQSIPAGTIIGEVGNSGGTSGPHLHFHAFKVDATGRVAAVPVAIRSMKSSGGSSVSGVPLGGLMYQTP